MNTAAPSLAQGLEDLRDALAQVRLGLELVQSADGRRTRDELAAQIGDYLLPRLRTMEAPLLMVVGGSTGAGKSTLVNSLLGAEVSPAGVLRPTTRAPVLAHHPDDLPWFSGDRVLPGVPRATGGEAGAGTLVLVPTGALPQGLALLDAPDIDSVAAENRALAAQLLAAADAWLFVTTAARYADAVPWELLQAARERGTALALVLDRVPDDAEEVVTGHLGEMLSERGLGGTELLVVPEARLDGGLLAPRALAPVRGWLDALAADAQARTALIERTLSGALASVGPRAAAVQAAAEGEATAAQRLRDEVDAAYARAGEEVEEALRSGTMLRGEVLARWHELIGTGDIMRALGARVAWARDRIRNAVTGRPAVDDEVRVAVESSVESLVRAASERAAERAARAWRADPAGRALLERADGLDRGSAELQQVLEREVRDWQRAVFELVRHEGAGKRAAARFASLGVNALGLTVMLAVFVSTGGLTGTEVVVAGGTSAAAQKILEAIFGDQAVRELAARAREDLLVRVGRVLDREAARYEAALEPVLAPEGAVEALNEARERVARAHR